MERISRLEQVVAQILCVPVPRIKEDISERTQIVDMPLLQAAHRGGYTDRRCASAAATRPFRT